MPTLSAPADTWGISGSDFLLGYLSLLGVFALLAALLRISVTRAGPDQPGRMPTAAEAAFLADGPARAIHAALAGLRTSGALGYGSGRLTTTGSLPAGASRLDGAVYEAIRRSIPVRSLAADPLVASALAEVETSATSAGWLLDTGQQVRARLGGVLLAGLAVLGVVRVAAGTANDRPVGLLVLLASVAAVLGGVLLLRVPRLTRTGRSALTRTAMRSVHLVPDLAPSWATYGAAGAAMGVALYGAAALWAADPAFAAATGLRQPPPAAASPGAGGCGGGGDGGGGGCGGGGCGG